MAYKIPNYNFVTSDACWINNFVFKKINNSTAFIRSRFFTVGFFRTEEIQQNIFHEYKKMSKRQDKHAFFSPDWLIKQFSDVSIDVESIYNYHCVHLEKSRWELLLSQITPASFDELAQWQIGGWYDNPPLSSLNVNVRNKTFRKYSGGNILDYRLLSLIIEFFKQEIKVMNTDN